MANVASIQRKNEFLQRVNHPAGSDLVTSVKQFIQSITKMPTSNLIDDNYDSYLVREFLDEMNEIMDTHPLWRSANDIQKEESKEGLEKYIIVNLHAKLFGNREDERKTDLQIFSQLKAVNWMTLEHMEVDPKAEEDPSIMELACSGKNN